ncbi:C-type Lectin CRL-like [Diretmus argenteus]
MRCIGTTIILLLVVLYTQDAAAAAKRKDIEKTCKAKFPAKKCSVNLGKDWYKLDGKRCMKLFKDGKSHADAQLACEDECGHLVSMHNNNEFSEVLCLLMREYPKTQPQVWIGGKRQKNGKYAWTDGSKFCFKRWTKNQPDFWKKKEECAEMNRGVFGGWNDYQCQMKQAYVCAVTVV